MIDRTKKACDILLFLKTITFKCPPQDILPFEGDKHSSIKSLRHLFLIQLEHFIECLSFNLVQYGFIWTGAGKNQFLWSHFIIP